MSFQLVPKSVTLNNLDERRNGSYFALQSDVDRVECFRLTLRFFDDVSTAS